MSMDIRYGSIKVLIESGLIQSIQQIFFYIPKTTVYKDLGVNFNRFDRAIRDPAIFRMEELMVLAELFSVDGKKLVELAYDQASTIQRKKQTKDRIRRNTSKSVLQKQIN